ncbi:Sec1-like protein [Dioscorea alata]|uniref:Sec1-like protein n=1 Tax=Dioscorea alata TaxID=55571 RepID=A0ACB7VC97_DIOAL|nr:Sec1-like protein [Dioscorea alata]
MASAIDVLRSCLDSIRQISDEVSDAVVYLDAGCLEAFQFIGAFPLLLQLGVRAVCSLENMSSLDIVVGWNSAFECPAKKMIIMTSRLLSDAHRYILRCLDTHQTIVHCTIFTSISEMDLKMEIFSLGDLSKTIGKMLTDMSSLYDVGRRNRKSAGLLLVDRTLDLLTPCCHGDSIVDRVFSSLPRRKRIASISASRSSQVPSKSAARVERPSLDLRVPFETVFSEEPAMSNPQLRESIKAFSSGWNSNGVNGSADIVEHAEKDQDNLLDNEISLLSGSFLAETIGGNYMEELLVRKSKDGVMLIKKLILEALKRENVTPNIRGRLSLAKDLELHGLVKKLAMNELSLIRNRWIIQLALASEKALSEPHSSHWDAFLSAERILNINSLDTSHSLSSQIRDLINTSVIVRSCDANNGTGASQSLLSFQDALLLSMIGYILAGENFPTSGSIGPFSWEEEHSLKEAVVDAILENPACTNLRFLHGLEKELEANSRKTESEEHGGAAANSTTVEDFDDQWGSWDDEDTDQNNDQAYGDMQFKLELRDRVDNLFKLFHKLSSLKQRHSTFKEGLIPSESNYLGDANSRKGLLYKLLNTLLAKYDVPGLQYHSSAVGRFLKSGFGRFGLGQAKPLLGDQNAIIIFVVGGISSVEIVEIMEAVSESSRPEIEFVVGGTTLLTPDDMSGLLLGSSSYL